MIFRYGIDSRTSKSSNIALRILKGRWYTPVDDIQERDRPENSEVFKLALTHTHTTTQTHTHTQTFPFSLKHLLFYGVESILI